MLDRPDGHSRLWCGPDDPVELALAVAKAREELGDEAEKADKLASHELSRPALAGGEVYHRFFDGTLLPLPTILEPQIVYKLILKLSFVWSYSMLKAIAYHQPVM
ncbi:unnamed protein product [Protopolystoma xenopodis]|uniref:Uncharacterized protein n=1 Tax=Protopolystoma xenopodis TaxID=117903 RepID=A0A448XR43_9PLAT|nr:unnamed protein product [Protopolystoma xenopodis]